MSLNKVLRNTAVGAAGGLLGALIMNAVPAIWSRLEKPKPSSGGGDDATVKAADAIYEELTNKPLPPGDKKVAGPIVHYAFGTAVGAFYGGLASIVPSVTTGFGIAYASLVWLLGDEIAVPALGFSAPPTEMPPSAHAKAFVSHIVFGATLEGTRQLGASRNS